LKLQQIKNLQFDDEICVVIPVEKWGVETIVGVDEVAVLLV